MARIRQARRPLRKYVAVSVTVLLLTLFVVIGCTHDNSVSGPNLRVWPGEPLRNEGDGCWLTPAQCTMIRNAIATLENHDDQNCKDLAASALERFSAIGYGFKQGDEEPGIGGYVELMQCPTCQYGYAPSNADVYINTSNLSNAGLWNGVMLPGLIGHEEFHHLVGWPPDHVGPPPPPCPLIWDDDGS